MNFSGAGKKTAQMANNRGTASGGKANAPPVDALFSGDGEMGALMQTLDWSKTAVGPVSTWPQSLKTAVRIILASRFPMFIWWGRELVNLYNDPYRAFLGIKHPAALAKSARDVWAEIWEQIGPRTDAVLMRGESTYDEALLLLMARHGYPEETYFTFSYSPLPDDQGNIAGIFCAVTEETDQVIGERRLRLLREIAAATAESRTAAKVCQSAAECLENARRDLPFSLIYLFDAEGKTLTKAAETGFSGPHVAAPDTVRIQSTEPTTSIWPFAEVVQSGQPVLLEDLANHFDSLPKGDWDTAPRCAILLPIAQQGQTQPSGVFVAGLNPYRKFTDDYRGFVSLLASQIGGSIANAVAYETERRRAEALADLDRAKTQFFSNVSHEFRTPLTLMLGPLEEVLPQARERLAPEQHEQLVSARRNALRLLKLVNTLLDFSRIEAGRVEAVYAPTDLCKLTEEISSVFRSAMEKAGLSFSVECEAVSGPAYVDRDMWEKIVLNLLSNAFKFTFEGSVVVRLRQIGNNVQLSVSDTGTGIPPDELPRVFERFHRVENTRARSFEGTGIGLALVQELAKLHGGSVDVSSTVGQGSTFTVAIPLGKAHLPADRIQAQPRLAPTAVSGEVYVDEAQRWLPQASGADAGEAVISMLPSLAATAPAAGSERESILLADDNADMREYVAHLLRDRYRVHVAADGVEAVEAARRLRPNLILTDVMMPRLDGFGVLRAIRDDASLSRTPVILLSARAGEESRVEGLHAGANDYLVKPFTARELLARVGSHLTAAKIRSEHGIASQRLAAIVESADDAIVSKDLNGIVTSWNRAAERIFGYSAEEMIGRSILTIIPPELQGDEPRILSTIARGERIDHFETVRLTKSGQRINVSLTVSPVRDETGTIIGGAKIARDITERKRIEEALRHAEKVAVAGRMALSISHEINNPLEAVTNALFLLHSHVEGDEGREFLGIAESQLERVSQITRQTLAFYTGKTSPQVVDLRATLDAVVSTLTSKIANKRIRLVRHEQSCEVLGLKTELHQLFLNLLDNAIDATPSNGRIEIAAVPQGSKAVITITDTGEGIRADHLPKLFEPFFTTKEHLGPGLGLWAAREIAQRHDGSITVDSRTEGAEHGTTFKVVLGSMRRRDENASTAA